MPNLLRLLSLLILLVPITAAAQDFPSKPIKLIVPFPPGGPNDIIARAVGQRMQEISGQPVTIDNRAGAGGVLGTDALAKSEPDGYTIAITSAGALAISTSLQEKLPYDSTKDFKPITLVAKVPEMLVVATGVPAANMKDLVALAKSKPGKLNFASSGPGSMPHLAGELFKMTAGIDIVHVPYRGAAPAVNDLLAQQVEMVFLDLPILLPQVQAGKLKPLAVGAKERAPSASRLPADRGGELVRHGGAGRHAAGDRGEAQPARQRRHAEPGRQGEAPEPGRNAVAHDSGAIRRLHPQRDREVGQGGAGRRHQAKLADLENLSFSRLD
jgi:tripartite-type tricarboxylate transporter receptor subunit TctC